jgi:hypothetical protein
MKWGMDAAELKIIGNYAQSELGHGTYLRCVVEVMTMVMVGVAVVVVAEGCCSWWRLVVVVVVISGWFAHKSQRQRQYHLSSYFHPHGSGLETTATYDKSTFIVDTCMPAYIHAQTPLTPTAVALRRQRRTTRALKSSSSTPPPSRPTSGGLVRHSPDRSTLAFLERKIIN